MTTSPLTEDEILDLERQLRELELEHRDLDQVIEQLCIAPPPDDLLVRRLKKRKLIIKDRINRIAACLEPDIPA